MKIIDAHMHFSNIDSFKQTARDLSFLNYSGKGLAQEYAEAGIVLGIGMGVTESETGAFPDPSAPTPMGLDLEQGLPANIVYCLGINPHQLTGEHLQQVEKDLQKPHVVGLKIYLGYYPFYAYDEVYEPIYELAAKYGVPVVFHAGDTYAERGLLKYSHPLTIDEVAVKHRDVTFMIAHLGDPWVLDAVEIVYKNRNVFADLSGIIVGDTREVLRHEQSPLFLHHLRHALAYADDYTKFLFGTDWPLVQVQPYVNLISRLIPLTRHDDVFYNNALRVFPKIRSFLK
ncbi:amidohydrolase family protein [Numidum massiliense]|uniref:amidohydrolase family protein n=1 Tax=Numidum massiliense TaxID=1522315 RepID=UPI0006D584BD|nr:TatD family hydrolase [Numidum massiliense]